MKSFLIHLMGIAVALALLIGIFELVILPYTNLLGGYITTILVLVMGLLVGTLTEHVVRHLTKEKA